VRLRTLQERLGPGGPPWLPEDGRPRLWWSARVWSRAGPKSTGKARRWVPVAPPGSGAGPRSRHPGAGTRALAVSSVRLGRRSTRQPKPVTLEAQPVSTSPPSSTGCESARLTRSRSRPSLRTTVWPLAAIASAKIPQFERLRRPSSRARAPSARAQARHRPSAPCGAYRDAAKTSPLPDGFRPEPAPGPPCAEADARRLIRIRRVYEPPATGPVSSWSDSGSGKVRRAVLRLGGGLKDLAERRPPSLIRPRPEEVDGVPIPLPRRACGPSRRAAAVRRGPVTLLDSARDPGRNSAAVLKACLEARVSRRRAGRRGAGARSRRQARIAYSSGDSGTLQPEPARRPPRDREITMARTWR